LKGEEIRRWIVPKYRFVLLFPYKIVEEKGYRHAVLLSEEELKKYPRIWSYLNENRSLLESRERGKLKGDPRWYKYIYEKNHEKFDLPKLLVQVLSNTPTFALDEEGKYYFVGGGTAGGNAVLLKEDSGITLKYLGALLNSSLLDWRVKQIGSEFEGGFYSYGKASIKDLPIKLPQTDEEKALAEEIEDTVEEIVELLKKHHLVKSLWEEWSGKLGNKKLTLKKLIETWEKGVGRIPRERLFFTDIRIISDEDTEYDGFELELEDGILKLLGREKDISMSVLELEGDKEILEHVYFSILNLLESRKKVKTLGDILNKTELPTVDGSPEGTKRIVSVIKEKAGVRQLTFSLRLKKEKEAYLDALIFKLYGLTKEEAGSVLRGLEVSGDYISRVVNFL
ncbi:MAG: hypothetical protein J7K57_05175, partial [Palaeococcus sp.]|uniref:TaqI-like C-terminal specificity domain-containing protein n=1 Tax=Palaeococcus sp. (in: euryarchaeotes) TaxID=2820298 RepID=UPI0025CC15E5